MTRIAISAQGLGKRYQLGVTHAKSLNELAARWTRCLRGLPPFEPLAGAADARSAGSEFWAIRDVSFEIRSGEVVGIIGRNGAGKSTLLKVLSRVTRPTLGRVRIAGRVASLLEVGTGFHPELTGRENVYMNGTLLGMTRREVGKRFDEIVDFSGVGAFVDTPVKRYSSGMKVRLGFAVAAHLEPEILIVDEVLAVGDASFQRKCLNKMQRVGGEGRTVLFVSHNMAAVTRLCPTAMLLDDGRVAELGPAHEVVRHYLGSGYGAGTHRVWRDEDAPGSEVARLRAVRLRDPSGYLSSTADIRRPLGLEMEYEVTEPDHRLTPNFHVFDGEGTCLFVVACYGGPWGRRPRPAGLYRSTCWIPGNFLAEGTLLVGAALSTMDPVRIHFFERDCVAAQIVDSLDGDSARGEYAGPMPGVIRPMLDWDDERVTEKTLLTR